MPGNITKYVCRYCHNEFLDCSDAVHCEFHGRPETSIQLGSTLSFDNEETMFGSRYTYSVESGIVVLSEIVYHRPQEGAPGHTWFHVLSGKNGTYEYGVLQLPEGRFISPAEYKYRKGYADNLNRELTRFSMQAGIHPSDRFSYQGDSCANH